MFDIVNGRLTIAGKAAPFAPTPNQGGRLEPTMIVLHDTAGRLTKGSAVTWLRDPKAKASAHVVVERDGSVTQLVAFDRVAWHAGQSSWRGRSGCNAFAVGIEIVNPGKLTGTPKKATAWFSESFGPEFGIVRAKTPAHGGCWMPYTEDQLRTVEISWCATTSEMGYSRVRGQSISGVVSTLRPGEQLIGAHRACPCRHRKAGARKRSSSVATDNATCAVADLEDPPSVRGRRSDPLGVGYRQDQQRGRAKAVQAVGAIGRRPSTRGARSRSARSSGQCGSRQAAAQGRCCALLQARHIFPV